MSGYGEQDTRRVNMTSSIPLPFLPHIRESRAYRRTYTDVGYEGFFNREIIGESVKPPRSFTVIPFFSYFLLDKPGGPGAPKWLCGIELQTKKISANNSINIAYASKEHKFLFYK